MLPSQCADQLADGTADIGLVPIASLAITPGLRILPGCTIASKAQRAIAAAGTARKSAARRSCAVSPPTRPAAPPLAYARILFHQWGNAEVHYLPMPRNLDAMLDRADAAIVIGDPALHGA